MIFEIAELHPLEIVKEDGELESCEPHSVNCNIGWDETFIQYKGNYYYSKTLSDDYWYVIPESLANKVLL